MSWDSPPPDPTNPDLLTNLRQYLISLGLVRLPRDGTNPTLPPMWLMPKRGVPAPGQQEGLNPVEVGKTVVLAARDATDIPPARYEGFIRHAHVEFVYRSLNPAQAKSLENQIRANLNDRRGWWMGNVQVTESLLFRGLQPVAQGPLGFTYTQEYQFDLWGPYTPPEG